MMCDRSYDHDETMNLKNINHESTRSPETGGHSQILKNYGITASQISMIMTMNEMQIHVHV